MPNKDCNKGGKVVDKGRNLFCVRSLAQIEHTYTLTHVQREEYIAVVDAVRFFF